MDRHVKAINEEVYEKIVPKIEQVGMKIEQSEQGINEQAAKITNSVLTLCDKMD